MRSVTKFIILSVVILALTACGSGGQEPGSNKNYFLDASDEVKSLYDVQCVSCHATDLRGHVGPSSNIQQVGSRLSKEDIILTIENGRGQMFAFKDKLSADEIKQLADWLATLQ